MPSRTWQQPLRTVLCRWRDGDVTWAELECEHVEPATGRDLATAIRCQQCNPVPLPRALPTPTAGARS